MRKQSVYTLFALLMGCNGDGTVHVAPGPSPLSLTVSWTAPTTYVDGKPLPAGAIAGYRIAYGTAPNALTQVIDVGPVQTHDLLALDPAVYYVTVRTRGANGEVSPPAGPASAAARR